MNKECVYNCGKCDWTGERPAYCGLTATERCPRCNSLAHAVLPIVLPAEVKDEIKAEQKAERRAQDVNFLANACGDGVQSGLDAMLGTDGPRLRLAPVVEMPNLQTFIPVAVQKVLDGAVAANLTRVMVIGRTPNGEFYLAASETEAGTLVWDLAKAHGIVMQ